MHDPPSLRAAPPETMPGRSAPPQHAPTALEGRWVYLEPLRWEHEAALAAISSDEDVWRYLPYSLATRDDVHRWLDGVLAQAARGRQIPFAIVERASGAVAGMTRLMEVRPAHRTAESGTWLGLAWRRTAVNSESKYLLLRYAFETLGCMRVTLKTDVLNVRSQRAIERLGAVREGIARKHMIVHGGRVRDSVYYSILDDEWPRIRAALEEKLYVTEPGTQA